MYCNNLTNSAGAQIRKSIQDGHRALLRGARLDSEGAPVFQSRRACGESSVIVGLETPSRPQDAAAESCFPNIDLEPCDWLDNPVGRTVRPDLSQPPDTIIQYKFWRKIKTPRRHCTIRSDRTSLITSPTVWWNYRRPLPILTRRPRERPQPAVECACMVSSRSRS